MANTPQVSKNNIDATVASIVKSGSAIGEFIIEPKKVSTRVVNNERLAELLENLNDVNENE